MKNRIILKIGVRDFMFRMMLAVCGVGCFSSCNYLDVVPDQIPTINDVFADRYAAEKALATCYWGLPRGGDWNYNPSIMGAFELLFNKEYIKDNGMRLALGDQSAASVVFNYWGEASESSNSSRSLYAGIRDCNTFLDNIGSVQDLPDLEKDRMRAEVKLLKAWMHFYLVCHYGPICPLRASLPVNESTQGARVYREKIDDCFAYILQLIDEALEGNFLPATIISVQTQNGRFTRAAAYTLKAKALVYWASPLFNGNTDYNSFTDHNGEPFFNQTYDPQRWVRAAEACKTAIEACVASGNRLFQESDYVKKKEIASTTLRINTLRNAAVHQWNVEMIYGNSPHLVNAWGANLMQVEALPRLEEATSYPTNGRMSAPFSVVDWFYSKNGVPIEEDKDYDYANRFQTRTGDDANKYHIAVGEQTAAMNFDREPRFYASLGFDRGKWYGNSYKSEPDNDADALYPKARWTEYSSSRAPAAYNATGYWPKKLVHLNTLFTDANSLYQYWYPWPELRYSGLLLYYAEALNESKAAPDEEVYRYIDEVRARAGLEGVVESWRKYSSQPERPLSKAGMRAIIQRERKIELAFEGQYYWDVRRWKTAPQELNRSIQGWNVQESTVIGYYQVTNLYAQRFTLRDYFAPIPESDLIKNPQLVQNQGW